MRQTRTIIRTAETGIEWADWYSEAHRSVRHTAYANGWSWRQFANVLAIVSPRVQVKRSIGLAMHWMRYGEAHPTTLTMTAKRLEHYRETGSISGYKCAEFSRALKGNTEAVVLDVWMARALGVEYNKFDPRDDRPSNKATIGRCINRVRFVADHMGISPRDAQAAIWAGSLLEHDRTPQRLEVSE